MDSITKNRQSEEVILQMVRHAFGNHLNTKDIELKELTEGFYNVAYEVRLPDRTAILKIAPPKNANILRYETNIMEAEVEGLRMVEANTDIPVPHVFCYDDSRQICEVPYFFMEKLEGDSFFKIKGELPPEKQQAIIKELGSLNASMNRISGQRFGYFGQPEKQQESWRQTFLAMIEDVLIDGENIEIGLGEGVDYDGVRSLIQKSADSLNEVTTPCFVHWDLWDGNVFVKDNRIVGLIDFERSLWGDPLMEYYFRRHCKNDSFLLGYGTQLREAAPVRALLYDIYLYLIMVIETKYRNYPDDWQLQFATKELKNSIEELSELIASKPD